MKYIVANADKGEDRLTVADVNNAAQTTAIFEFLKAGKTVAKRARFETDFECKS